MYIIKWDTYKHKYNIKRLFQWKRDKNEKWWICKSNFKNIKDFCNKYKLSYVEIKEEKQEIVERTEDIARKRRQKLNKSWVLTAWQKYTINFEKMLGNTSLESLIKKTKWLGTKEQFVLNSNFKKWD